VSGGSESGLSAWAVALLSLSGSIAAALIAGFFCFFRETFERTLNGEFAAMASTIPVAKLQRKFPGLWTPSIQIPTRPVRVF
jgi:hypothetical protein